MTENQTEDRFTVCEINCETGETVYREYTEEEKQRYLEGVAIYEAREAERIAAESARAELKNSAKMKLISGQPLTEEEASTIVL
jgi:hypothetical protein